MTTQKFDQLLRKHNVTNPFEKGFYPHIGTRYALYRVDEDVHILWCGADQYVRTAWLPNVWLPAHCIQTGLGDVVETAKFHSRNEAWQPIEKGIVWYEPSWLGLTPATEQEILKFARGNWQRSCFWGNLVYFNQPSGSASRYTLYYKRSLQNMLERIEAAGYLLVPVYGPRDGGPKEYLIYRS